MGPRAVHTAGHAAAQFAIETTPTGMVRRPWVRRKVPAPQGHVLTAARQEPIPLVFYGYAARRADEVPSLLDVSDPELSTTASLKIGMPGNEPYNLEGGTHQASYSQYSQDTILSPILEQIKNGFFVESGARDGETHSNTIYYELRGWTGLLVEPSAQEFARIEGKHRKAYTFQGCLSPTSHSELLHFTDSGDGLSHVDETSSFTTLAVPLPKLLRAINRTTVDFWSPNVEGSEGAVLNALDFNEIEVGVILVEMNKNIENNCAIRDAMLLNGFVDIGSTVSGSTGEQLDRVFASAKYFKARGLQMSDHVDEMGSIWYRLAASIWAHLGF